jgi:type I restriction enzyme S subunit
MNSTWRMVRLAEVARPLQRAVIVESGVSYRTIGVKWWGEGAYERQTIDGSRTAAKTLSIVREGDLIINKIWVRHGSTAIATKAVDGCAASGEFPTFELDRSRVLPRWIHWLSKTKDFWVECERLSQGTSGKNRIKPEKFLTIEIPLPPLAEQWRVVARVDELASKIEEARGLRKDSAQKVTTLMKLAVSEMLNEEKWEIYRLEKILAEPPRNGLAPQPEAASEGLPMLRINAVSSAPTRFVDLTAYKMVDVDENIAEPFILKHEDVFIVRYNGDINRVAKAAIFKANGDCNVIYPDKLMRLRPDRSKMLPDFLVYALGCESVRAQIEELGKTTAGQIGVSGKDAKSFQIPVPPLSEQERIVTHLDNMQARADMLKRLQAETAEELDALLPSILDKAFKGML